MKADMAKQAAITQDVKRYIWLHNIEPLISDELVEEHRRNPLGLHSADLDRVLYFLRSDPVPVREGIYDSVEEIEHAVFLERLAAVRASYGALEVQAGG